MNNEQLERHIGRFQTTFDEIDDEAPYEWQVFGTLTFQHSIGLSKSRRLLDRWLAQIKKTLSPHFFNWVAVLELNRGNNNVRIHVLLGGLYFSFQDRWALRWQELSGGDAKISDYRPGAFSRHVLKNSDAGLYYQIEMDLCGWGLLEISRE